MTGLEQIGIAVFGVAAIFLTNAERPEARRWACICGLAAQPFWAWTAIANAQWGILALTLLYGYGWWRGFRRDWWRRKA